MKKNRIFGLVMASVLIVSALCGCGTGTAVDSDQKGESAPQNAADASKYSIVCTTFPQYDWIRNIIGDDSDKFQLTMLLDQGMDLHSYQPTAEDIAKISDADMRLLYLRDNVMQFFLETDSRSDIWQMIMGLPTMLRLWDAVRKLRQALRR